MCSESKIDLSWTCFFQQIKSVFIILCFFHTAGLTIGLIVCQTLSTLFPPTFPFLNHDLYMRVFCFFVFCCLNLSHTCRRISGNHPRPNSARSIVCCPLSVSLCPNVMPNKMLMEMFVFFTFIRISQQQTERSISKKKLVDWMIGHCSSELTLVIFAHCTRSKTHMFSHEINPLKTYGRTCRTSNKFLMTDFVNCELENNA